MLILLTKKDARRILDLDNSVGQLRNDVQALKSQWDNERIALHDIKEQITNTLRRLEQRHTRAKKAEEEQASPTPSEPHDEVTERILERRRQRAVRGIQRGPGVSRGPG